MGHTLGLPVYQPTWDVWRTRAEFVNHEPKASDLQAFRLFCLVIL